MFAFLSAKLPAENGDTNASSPSPTLQVESDWQELGAKELTAQENIFSSLVDQLSLTTQEGNNEAPPNKNDEAPANEKNQQNASTPKNALAGNTALLLTNSSSPSLEFAAAPSRLNLADQPNTEITFTSPNSGYAEFDITITQQEEILRAPELPPLPPAPTKRSPIIHSGDNLPTQNNEIELINALTGETRSDTQFFSEVEQFINDHIELGTESIKLSEEDTLTLAANTTPTFDEKNLPIDNTLKSTPTALPLVAQNDTDEFIVPTSDSVTLGQGLVSQAPTSLYTSPKQTFNGIPLQENVAEQDNAAMARVLSRTAQATASVNTITKETAKPNIFAENIDPVVSQRTPDGALPVQEPILANPTTSQDVLLAANTILPVSQLASTDTEAPKVNNSSQTQSILPTFEPANTNSQGSTSQNPEQAPPKQQPNQVTNISSVNTSATPDVTLSAIIETPQISPETKPLETASTAASPSGTGKSLGAPPPVTSHIAVQQVGEAILRQTDKTGDIVIRLDPAELGKVNITFTFDKAGTVNAHVVADTASTTAVLRDRSDILSAHLKQSGFENVNLSFDTNNSDQNHKGFGSQFSNQSQSQQSTSNTKFFDIVEQDRKSPLLRTPENPQRAAQTNGPLDMKL